MEEAFSAILICARSIFHARLIAFIWVFMWFNCVVNAATSAMGIEDIAVIGAVKRANSDKKYIFLTMVVPLFNLSARILRQAQDERFGNFLFVKDRLLAYHKSSKNRFYLSIRSWLTLYK